MDWDSVASFTYVQTASDEPEATWGPEDEEHGKYLLGTTLWYTATSLSGMSQGRLKSSLSWSPSETFTWQVPKFIKSGWASIGMSVPDSMTFSSEETGAQGTEAPRQSRFFLASYQQSRTKLIILHTPYKGYVAVFESFTHGPAWYVEASRGSKRMVGESGSMNLYTTSCFKFRKIAPTQDLLRFDLEAIVKVALEDPVELSIEHPGVCEASSGKRQPPDREVYQAIYIFLTRGDVSRLLEEKREVACHQQDRRRRKLAYALAACVT